VGCGGGKVFCGGSGPSREAGLSLSGISWGLRRGGTSNGSGGVPEGVWKAVPPASLSLLATLR
jgi:hypothetical protein